MLKKIILSDKIDIEHLYEQFCTAYLDKKTRSNFKDKFIYIEFNRLIDGKSEDFWHMISLSEEDTTSFSILPCNNDSISGVLYIT
ncbi:MAG TPA: hypothetical protein DCP90_04905 [Clostridiales bacterium]|nr:MAG: hypothetical protein A2Y22_06360 [Clostridiales bacterium GWD2_32_59]HAN09937.1 hypothetical protein [Clostridiales bacterium]